MGLCFTSDVPSFFLFSPRVLRAPSTDRPETLPHGRNLAVFYNPTPKIRGRSPQKWGPKTCKISVNFGPLQTIANISIRNGWRYPKSAGVTNKAIPPAFNEKSPVNFGPLTAWNSMWVWTTKHALFWHTVSRPLGGAALWNFYTR